MSAPTSAAPTTKTRPGDHEEPGITQEESVPSDGKDEVGEKMMEGLGRDKAQNEKGPAS